jgi:hypothetical protein
VKLNGRGEQFDFSSAGRPAVDPSSDFNNPPPSLPDVATFTKTNSQDREKDKKTNEFI